MKRPQPSRYSDPVWAPPFRYSDQDWLKVEAYLRKLAPDTAADARIAVEGIVDDYLWQSALSDPRSLYVIATRACLTRVAKRAAALAAALEALKAQMKDTLHADYLALKEQCAKAAHWAATEAKNFRKSASGSNRARGDHVDKLFAELLEVWVGHGGRVGTSPKSPSTKFVVAAAGKALVGRIPGARLSRSVSDFTRVAFRRKKNSP